MVCWNSAVRRGSFLGTNMVLTRFVRQKPTRFVMFRRSVWYGNIAGTLPELRTVLQ